MSIARLIPGRLKIFALPLSVPEAVLNKTLFTPELVRKWKGQYALDFSSYAGTCSRQNYHTLINTFTTRDWPRLASPVLVADIDLHADPAEFLETRHAFEVTQTGTLSGILIFFEIRLSKTVGFSIHPDEATIENSWASKLWIPGTAIHLKEGKKAELIYRYNENEKSGFEIIR